ncbi:right-handed parallel beta-helix repeat-containing protein [Mucisphaera calidilacus]|uniref:Right handed beta helix domain-containing protein n=1 Tax=Mucisphaera calidilacus TaxID=2527982 RepID=A0A518C181_9BACT|nr:right-handed parallel beta-helix repeat-containing protein [Mucisphaera calidilacus]QDU72954.1 hypothetical protein Pan265_28310 [Mucisphaera calidilacus]
MAPQTLYIDPNTTTAGDGTSPQHPLSKLPLSFRPQPGTHLLYRRGSVARQPFPLGSGSEDQPVVIGAYGEGPKPLFLGSIDVSSPELWVPAGENRWRCTQKLPPGANLIFFDNDNEHCGAMRWSHDQLTTPRDWCMAEIVDNQIVERDYLLVHAENNPATQHQRIEFVPEWKYIVFRDDHHHIRVRDLEFRYIGTHALQVSGGHHIEIIDCDIAYVGGAIFKDRIGINGLWVRYGNAIEIWEAGHDIRVEGCKVYETYDAGFVAQGSSAPGAIRDVNVRNNWFYDNGFDNFDNSWGEHAILRVAFEHNTCVNAGGGWGYVTEGRPRLSEFLPDAIGWHVFLDNQAIADSTITIRHNIFCDAPGNPLVRVRQMPGDGWRGVVMDHNAYFQSDPDDPLFDVLGQRFHNDDLDLYRQQTGQEHTSIIADPHFVNRDRHDYRLQPDSPCNGLGANIT